MTRASSHRGLGGFLTISLLMGAAHAHAGEGTLTAFTTSPSYSLPYVEYLPPGYAASVHPRPVVFMLHGQGQMGGGTDATDLMNNVTGYGLCSLIKWGSTYFKDHDSIVICPRSSTWWKSSDLHALIGYVKAHYTVDPNRIYLTGPSMGGGGTWDYLHDYPGVIAAAVPICGASSPSGSSAGAPMKNLPIWAFHNFADPQVTRNNTIWWSNAIAYEYNHAGPTLMTGYPNKNADVTMPAATDQTAVFNGTTFSWSQGVIATGSAVYRVTIYPGNSHDAWTATYNNNAVLDWMYAKVKPSTGGGDLGVPPDLAGTDGGGAEEDLAAPGPDDGTPPELDADGSTELDGGVAAVPGDDASSKASGCGCTLGGAPRAGGLPFSVGCLLAGLALARARRVARARLIGRATDPG